MGVTTKLAVAVAALMLMVLAAPLLLDGESEDLDDARRSAAVGDFARSSRGLVHYQIGGPADGPRVALVHGMSTPLFTWDAVWAGLTTAGFRVLRYDLYGRGFSDRPIDVDYDQDLYDEQLRELLDFVGWRGAVHLAGLSMGGPIIVEFAARRPQHVASLSLFDPAGFPVNLPATAALIKVPLIGDYLMRVFGDRTIRNNLQSNFYDQSLVPDFAERFLPQMKLRGFKHAQLSTLRHMRLTDMEDRFRRIGELGLPVFLVWGKQDAVVPFANAARLRALIPQTRFLAVEECGHTPNYEKPDEVLPPLIDFLRSASH